MKPFTEKMLKSGLIDKHTVQLLERWGHLPEGSSELVDEKALENATREGITRLVEDIASEVEKDRILRETTLDLNALRWPVELQIRTSKDEFVANVFAVVDRMNRYYFKADEIKQDWLVPGRVIRRFSAYGDSPISDTILEVTPLYVGTTVVAIQVSTK